MIAIRFYYALSLMFNLIIIFIKLFTLHFDAYYWLFLSLRFINDAKRERIHDELCLRSYCCYLRKWENILRGRIIWFKVDCNMLKVCNLLFRIYSYLGGVYIRMVEIFLHVVLHDFYVNLPSLKWSGCHHKKGRESTPKVSLFLSISFDETNALLLLCSNHLIVCIHICN